MINELQSFTSKGIRKSKDGPRRLNSDELDRVWDEIQAKSRREGLGWTAPDGLCGPAYYARELSAMVDSSSTLDGEGEEDEIAQDKTSADA